MGRPRNHDLSDDDIARLQAAPGFVLRGSTVRLTTSLSGPLALGVLDAMAEGESLKDFLRSAVDAEVTRRSQR